MLRFSFFSLALSAAVLIPAASAGTVVFDSTGDTPNDLWFCGPDTSLSCGQVFTSGSQAGTLSGIELLLENATSNVENYNVLLYSGTASSEGSLIATVGTGSVPANQTGFSLDSVTLAGTQPVLAANTEYWLVLSNIADQDLTWGSTTSPSGTGVAGNVNLFYSGGDYNSNEVYITQISETASAPEPSTLLGVGCALAAGLAFRRRISRSAR